MNGKDMNATQWRKYRVLSHYSGGGTPYCACCGERNLEFLTINHINHDGYEHRKKLKRQHTTLYIWLIRKHFPEGFNVLCFNCNFADGHFEGGCPHKKNDPNIKMQLDKALNEGETALKKLQKNVAELEYEIDWMKRSGE